ncbi:MAG TPA: energy transducer TonB [Bryobacteraceae bacterium]
MTDWGDPAGRKRTEAAGVLSVLAHVALIVTLMTLPPGLLDSKPPKKAEAPRVITPLIEPPTEMTQKAPNKGKVNKEFDAAELKPRPQIQVPAGPISTTRPRALQPAPVPLPPAAAQKPVTIPDAPKVETAANPVPQNPLAQAPPLAPPPPPQIQAEEKIKSPFESPNSQPLPNAGGRGRIPLPDPSVANAIRQNIQQQGGSGGLMVGDQGAAGPGGYGPGINLPPSPGVQGSSLELKSDAMGVDFRPYLIQILTAVRRNWMAVMPESVKLGQRGKVAVLFSIDRHGTVTKANYAQQSGARALDQAAIAAISASNPFPPLPTDFKGDRIVLQLNFAYNMPKQ